MKKYSESDNYALYQGNMLDMLQEIKQNSVDSIVTDPPYGLTSITKRFGKENSAPAQYGKDGAFSRLSRGFMGKEWDGSGIEYNIETWKKCYEILKPGGYLLAFGGSRTYHRIACAIEDAGFEIRDCIMWLYGSGFPKSMDISKQIDKHGGNSYTKQFADDLKKARESRNLTVSYCDKKYCNGSTNWSWYEGRKDGSRVPDYNTYLEIVKEFPELEKYKDLIKEAEREIIGQKKNVGCFNNENHYTVGGTKANDIDITIPKTELAKQWQGWGTCLKPAYEPIIVARKPFKGSLVDNVIENGVGGINIDECRVGNEERTYKGMSAKQPENAGCFRDDNWQPKDIEITVNGRFPANVIHDGLQEEWSRYFYTPKASKKDRDEGLDEFEEVTIDDGRNKPIDNPFQRGKTQRHNIHPTVKPTELMQYLVRLVTPKNGIVLDPFMGSGSTGKACMYENKERNANYKFIGIEFTEEYLPIAEARINYANKQAEKEDKTRQLNIFEME